MTINRFPDLTQTVFTGNPLDRMDNVRMDGAQIDAWLDSDDSRVMILQDGRPLVDEYGDLAWLPLRKLRWVPLIEQIFLGLDRRAGKDQARFAACVSEGAEEALNGHFTELREMATAYGHAHPDLAIIAQAKSMLTWHESHSHCSNCGEAPEMVRAGYERKCQSCDTSHFPRTDPVVIMLAIHEESDSILVGRPHHLPENLYTALAGFMEPGERIEEAVARELHEESGVEATQVKYIASQPWPYPSSLMIGCHALVESRDLVMDAEELADLKWMSRNEAEKSFAGLDPNTIFPPQLAIAHQLVSVWLNKSD